MRERESEGEREREREILRERGGVREREAKCVQPRVPFIGYLVFVFFSLKSLCSKYHHPFSLGDQLIF